MGERYPQFEPHSRTEGGHGPGVISRVGLSSIISMADSEAALKSRPCVAFIIRSALVCLETGNPWMATKGTDTKAASKSRRCVAFSAGRPSVVAKRQNCPTAARHLRSPGDVRVGVGVRDEKRSYSTPSTRIFGHTWVIQGQSEHGGHDGGIGKKNTQRFEPETLSEAAK